MIHYMWDKNTPHMGGQNPRGGGSVQQHMIHYMWDEDTAHQHMMSWRSSPTVYTKHECGGAGPSITSWTDNNTITHNCRSFALYDVCGRIKSAHTWADKIRRNDQNSLS